MEGGGKSVTDKVATLEEAQVTRCTQQRRHCGSQRLLSERRRFSSRFPVVPLLEVLLPPTRFSLSAVRGAGSINKVDVRVAASL